MRVFCFALNNVVLFIIRKFQSFLRVSYCQLMKFKKSSLASFYFIFISTLIFPLTLFSFLFSFILVFHFWFSLYICTSSFIFVWIILCISTLWKFRVHANIWSMLGQLIWFYTRLFIVWWTQQLKWRIGMLRQKDMSPISLNTYLKLNFIRLNLQLTIISLTAFNL